MSDRHSDFDAYGIDQLVADDMRDCNNENALAERRAILRMLKRGIRQYRAWGDEINAATLAIEVRAIERLVHLAEDD